VLLKVTDHENSAKIDAATNPSGLRFPRADVVAAYAPDGGKSNEDSDTTP
jgi:hypothetical protein